LGDISTIDGIDYFETGNHGLDPEKQLVASFNAGLGQPGNDLQISLTGGKIFAGIDWEHYYLDTLGGTFDAYRPINHDIDFIGATLLKRFTYRDNIWLYGGVTCRYDKVGGNDNPYYSPDFQGFAAIQLHHYVDLIGTHFYGYLEAIGIGKYDTPESFQSPGYTFGNQAVVNLKLSFRIKEFRFYFVSQNLLAEYYSMRDGYPINDRFAFYGLTWKFLD